MSMNGVSGKITMGLLVGVFAAAAATAQPVKVGAEFPKFSDTDVVTGKTISMEDMRGKVVLVDFWATWCGPCVAELPNVKQAYDKYHKKGFEIISISLDNNIDKCKSFIDKEGMRWHHIADGKGWQAKLAKKFGVNSIPKAYVIGRDGLVISDNARAEDLEKAIEKGLKTVAEDLNDDVEKEAQTALAKADELRSAKKYAEALAAYDDIGAKYTGRPTAKIANERARDLREDPDVQAALKSSDGNAGAKPELKPSEKAQKLLKLARSMRDAKKYDASRRYYQQIVDEYADSAEAKTAQEELGKLPK